MKITKKILIFFFLGLSVGHLIKTQFLSPGKTALKIIKNGETISVFACEESGEKCVVIAVETLTKNKNKYFVSTLKISDFLVEIEISKAEKNKNTWAIKPVFFKNFNSLPRQWEKICKNKIQEYLVLVNNRS
ncbi:MAG: hypothetical protein ABIG90_03005 [bacterium]